MLTVRLLGEFSIEKDGHPVEISSRPGQSLLAWLILHPGVAHRRERLAGLFWPDATESNARNNLRHALWRLRRVVPDGFVQADKISIRWEAGADWQLDVDRLTALPTEAARADDLLPALQACAGELLPGFHDEWVARQRERVAALYEERIGRLLALLLTESRWREAIDWGERWIARGHTPEPAYRGLMQAHASLGNSAAALTIHQRCVEDLEQELGVPPSAETENLADAIRHSQFTIHTSQFSSPLHPAIRSNLPAATTPLIGRESELAQLADLLTDPAHRLVTILGPGGMGKSRLALAAAHAALDHFPDGVFVVELASLTSVRELARAIGDAIDYPFQDDPRSSRQQLLDYLRGRKLLLLLDNFEHLLAGAELLIALLEGAPSLHLLVTSRERLRLHAETLLRLDGLAFPAAAGRDPPRQDGYAAVDLFVQSTRRSIHGYSPNPDQWPAIARICRLVDGMPLGIVLAASWVEHLPPGKIADEIAASVAFLGQELHDLDPRHRTIEAVLVQSWLRLSNEERSALMGLSIFAGGVDRAAAQSVAAASFPVITRLMDKALLWRVGDGRYDLHELVRQLARQKLGDTGQEEAVRALHSRWFLTLVSRQEPRLKGSDTEDAIELLERERENVRAAWDWAAQQGEIEQMQQAIESLGIFHNRPGQWQEGEELMNRAAIALAGSSSPQARLLLAWLSAWQGLFLHHTEKVADAHEAIQTSQKFLETSATLEQDTQRLRAFLHLHTDGQLMESRDREAMGRNRQRAVALFQELEDPWWLARAQLVLGNLEFFEGKTRQAEERLRAARRTAETIGDNVALVQVLDRLGFLAEHAGRFDDAAAITAEYSAYQAELTQSFADSKQRRSWTMIALGRFAEAQQAATDGLQYGQDVGVGVEHLYFTINNLARAHLHLGRFEQAHALAASATEIWAGAHGWEHPFLLRTQGMALLGTGSPAQAQAILSRVRADQQKMGNDNFMPLAGALVDESYPFLVLGEFAQARRALGAGLELTQRVGLHRFTIQALPAVGVLLAADERLDEAGYIYGLIQRYAYLTNSRWYATIALERLAQRVGPATGNDRAAQRNLPADLPAINMELQRLLAPK